MRKGLIVGIDDPPTGVLHGSTKDAKKLANILSRNFDTSLNFDCTLLLSSEQDVTERVLKAYLHELFNYETDIALFYFSGHGIQNYLGVYLATQDGTDFDEGVSLDEIITLANASPAREVVIFLDCCYSGRAGVLTSFDPSKAILRKGLSIISSSSSNQPSVQKGNQGIFTSILCEALNGGAADILGETNISSIYAYVAKLLKAWDQNPILKSHIWRLVSLRKCKPLIEPDILRRLITYFPKDDHFFKLDSSYAPSAEPSNHQHEMIFADLQKFVTLGLVDPVGDDHLYFAAIHDEGCELTPLGIFYWNRALKQSF